MHLTLVGWLDLKWPFDSCPTVVKIELGEPSRNCRAMATAPQTLSLV